MDDPEGESHHQQQKTDTSTGKQALLYPDVTKNVKLRLQADRQ